MELTEEMEKLVRSELDKIQGEIGPSFDTGESSNKIIALVDYLHDSEKRLIIAIEKSQHLLPTVKVPKSGRAEFGWLPYLFKHAKGTGSSDPLVKYLQEVLKRVFGKYESTLESLLSLLGILLDPQITKEQWVYLEKNMGKHDIIAGDGTIVGDGKYEDLDKDWLYAPAWYLFNLVFPWEVAPFILPRPVAPSKPAAPFNGPIGSDSQSIKIAIIGDWGTGKYESASGYDPATWVMQAVENLMPDYVIHLGDVYYAGTDLRYPPGEEANNFLYLWPKKFSGKSFTLNSNHEMYGGAKGYFDIALNRSAPKSSPFSVQNGFSYFALEFDPWVLVGFDAAYHDTSILYMQGGIGTEKTIPGDPQLEFLSKLAKQYAGKQIILFSHQTGMSTDGKTFTNEDTGELLYPLLSQLQATGLTPDYWYWGHVHLGLVYGDQSVVTKATKGMTKARCVGHSAVPFGNPWGLSVGGNIIDYIANTPIPGTNMAMNGLAMLTLTQDGGITEEFFDGVKAGSKAKPVAKWKRVS